MPQSCYWPGSLTRAPLSARTACSKLHVLKDRAGTCPVRRSSHNNDHHGGMIDPCHRKIDSCAVIIFQRVWQSVPPWRTVGILYWFQDASAVLCSVHPLARSVHVLLRTRFSVIGKAFALDDFEVHRLFTGQRRDLAEASVKSLG
jgi:hypothetical protein